MHDMISLTYALSVHYYVEIEDTRVNKSANIINTKSTLWNVEQYYVGRTRDTKLNESIIRRTLSTRILF